MRAMSCRNGDKLIHQIYAWISNWEIGSNGSNISGLERDYFFLQLSHDSYEIMNICLHTSSQTWARKDAGNSQPPEPTKRMSTPISGRNRVGDTRLPCAPPTTFRPMVSKLVPPQYSSSQPEALPFTSASSSPSAAAAAASFSSSALADIITGGGGGGGRFRSETLDLVRGSGEGKQGMDLKQATLRLKLSSSRWVQCGYIVHSVWPVEPAN